MKREQVQERIAAVEREFFAARRAVALLVEQTRVDPSTVADLGIRPSDVRDCSNNLERTYMVRMFADWEAGLRDVWANALGQATAPPMRDLLEALSARLHIDATTLAEAHEAREYRNALVHLGRPPRPMSLAQARSRLRKFFSYMPRDW